MLAQTSLATSPRLSTLPVLFVDCQATGATPKHGSLLEVAWCVSSASAADAVSAHIEGYLVRLPGGVGIPRRVSDVTGITREHLSRARKPKAVWARLAMAARAARSRHATGVPTVAHWARFERAFLAELRERFPDEPAPELDFLCTHDVSRRLCAALPRRGLHALAGYFGKVIPHEKRAHAHVLATAVVWRALVDRLAEQEGVTTLDELRTWLKTAPVPKRSTLRPELPMSREERLALPDAPGVYRMRAPSGEVLYVGKATSLKQRFNSHFRGRLPGRSERSLELLTQAASVEVTRTGSPLEAALLETDEIKRLDPPYNVALRARNPACWFTSDDLDAVVDRPDVRYRLGPFPSPELPTTLGRIAWLVSGRRKPSRIAIREALGFEDRSPPSTEVFRDGVRLFRAAHEPLLRARGVRAGLRTLGAQLWVTIPDASDDPIPEDGDDERVVSRGWTAERVAGTLEWNVARAAHLLRRARWLTGLSESAIVWQPKNEPDDARRMVLLVGGRVVESDIWRVGQPPPTPPGHRRNPRERRTRFDAATYDRLRVLTTELRRLVADESDVRVRLSEHRELNRQQLARRLAWV